MAVSLCLHSHFPIIVLWGPDLILFYNDAYRPILGAKHPAVLGQPARQVWPEVWPTFGPLHERVLTTGQATWANDLAVLIEHQGTLEERYFTFSLSPIHDEAGTVRGVFCPVTETTERILGERRQQALRQEAEAAREHVTQTLESITDAFFTVDREWRFTYVNRRAKQLAGRLQDDFLGKRIWDEFPEAAQGMIFAHFQQALREQVPVEFEEYYAPLGIWAAVHAYPSPEGLAVYFHDITARKLAEEASLRLAAIVASSDDAIISKSLDGVVTSWNAAAERIFGYQAEEMIGQPILRLQPEDRQEEENMILERLRRGERIDHFETVRRTKDGRLLDVSVTISPMRNARGTIIGASKIARDITERKQLEGEFAQRAAELERLNTELQQFGYIVSHDLQEPLRTIISFVQLLAQHLHGQKDAQTAEFIAFAVDGTQRMQALITDLLAYTRVSGKAQAFTAVDCAALLERVLGDLRLAIQDSAAEVTHDALPTVHGDAGQLGLVFQNLISNALKFRGETPPRIHIAARREGAQWIFAVRDNGIGIDSQHGERIFEVFQRLHIRSEYPGTGIGLAICKKIVEQHGGRIWVESAAGQGATFRFTLSAEA
jgi:PAS domain S-box-containing protein